MKEKIPCEIIEDLLPLYVENLTQEASKPFIQDHIMHCKSCNEKYQNMLKQIGKEVIEEEHAILEIDYLKKIRQKNKKKIILSSFITLAVLTMAAAIKLFYIGQPISAYNSIITIKGQNAEISGTLEDSLRVYSHYKIKNGELLVYGCLPTFGKQNRDFSVVVDLSKGDIMAGGNLIKSNGKIITKKALALYDEKHLYIGDMSANGALARDLGIYDDLGMYLNSLQTSKEPYGWTLEFQKEVRKGNQIKFDSTMESYACVLLALVDNCNEVSWTYTCNQKLISRTLTTEEANKKIGYKIKSYSSSSERVQELLGLLNIK